MQLTLKSLQQIQDTSVEALGLLKCVEAENNAELQMELQNLSVQASGAIQILEQFINIRDSLKVSGYSDQWYDITFGNSNLKDLCTIEMPKFLDNDVNRGKACMEGIMETLRDWVKKAGQLIINIIKGIMRFAEWLVSVLRKINSSDKQAKSIWERAIDFAVKKSAEMQLGIKLEDYYDFEKITQMVANVHVLLTILCPISSKTHQFEASSSMLSSLNKGGKSADDLKKDFFSQLQSAFAAKGINTKDMATVGYQLKFDPAANKYIEFLGGNGQGDFEKKAIDVEHISDVTALIKQQIDDAGAKIHITNGSLIDVQIMLKERLGHFEEMSRAQYQSDGSDDNGSADAMIADAVAGVVLTRCALSIISDALSFIARVTKAHEVNKKYIDALVKAVYADAQKA